MYSLRKCFARAIFILMLVNLIRKILKLKFLTKRVQNVLSLLLLYLLSINRLFIRAFNLILTMLLDMSYC